MLEDVDADVAVLGILHCILHLEAVTCGNGHTGQQQIDVGRSVGSAELDGLLVAEVHLGVLLQWVGTGHHIAAALAPSQRHTHHSGAVTVAPADIGGGLLMRHQTEIAGGIGIAEGRERTGQAQDTGHSLQGHLAQTVLTHVHVLAIQRDAGVDMHTATSLADGNLGGEGDGDAILVAQLTHHPLGNHQLIGGSLKACGEKLYLVLLIHQVAMCEVAHLAMAVLDFATGGSNHTHSLGAELLELAERHADMIAVLVLGHIVFLLGSDGIVLQLTHHLELHATRSLAESAGCFLQRVFGSHSKGFSILGIEGAEQVERRHFGEGVEERCTETWDNI